MNEAVIVAATRTPIGSFNGTLANVGAVELGVVVIKEVLRRGGIDGELVEQVIFGNVLQAGQGQKPARQAALKAGVTVEAAALTLNMVCGSGLEAVNLAAKTIISNEAEIIVAGGMESMTNAPYALGGRSRWGYRMGHEEITDVMLKDGLWCAINDYHMGITAENLAAEYGISREAMDRLAEGSQFKAVKAIASGAFSREIVPVEYKTKNGLQKFSQDEFPRSDASYEKLAALRPAFKADGLVTAGNSSGVNDGAAALLLMSARRAEKMGLRPLAKISSFAVSGVEPSRMGIAPASAVRKALQKAGLELGDIDLLEMNEAFAAQALAVGKELDLDWEKVNVNGGAIALGHPIGASGARILVTLLHALEAHGKKNGLAALCVGGGQGVATVVERLA